MARGFLYLVAIIDWTSRAVPAWRLSNSMDVSFCLEAFDEALACFGKPEILNTDQGSQFTSAAFTGRLEAADIRISMDGRGRWLDNVFVERLWRSLTYEEVHLRAYGDGREARAGISAWVTFYKPARPHQALANRMPMAVWRAGVTGALPANAVDMTLRLDDVARRPHPHSDRSSDHSFHGVKNKTEPAAPPIKAGRASGPGDRVHLSAQARGPARSPCRTRRRTYSDGTA